MQIQIKVPGSKSIANRVLLLKALCNSKTEILNIPDCDDCNYMISALKSLFQKSKEIKLFTGNAGTTTRFLAAYCTLLNKKIIIDGNKRMQERPIQALVEALNSLGAKVETKNGCPPLIIYPQKITGGSIKLPGNISSQYLSALLMILPFVESDSTITIEQKLYSKPYIEITLQILKDFGLKIKNNNFEQFIIKGNQKPRAPKKYIIESDASSASYIGAYAALHPEKSIIIENLNKKSIQGDIEFLGYLKKMGCKITEQKNNTKIKGSKTLKSLGKIDMNETPDLVMTFAVLAAFTKEKTIITNIENLRIKETDRIKALENELKKIGARIKTGRDYIEIEGPCTPPSKTIEIETYDDHRIAMSFGIIQDILPQLKIKNPNCVSKSYSTFWRDLIKLQK